MFSQGLAHTDRCLRGCFTENHLQWKRAVTNTELKLKKTLFPPREIDGAFTTANTAAKTLKYHDIANLPQIPLFSLSRIKDAHTHTFIHRHTQILPWVMSIGLEWPENWP